MNIDINAFFRQAALLICRSLDIEKAMRACHRYLESFMPVTGMYLALFDPEQASINVLAVATLYRDFPLERVISLSEEAVEKIREELKEQQGVIVVNRPEAHPVGRRIIQVTGNTNVSNMIMHLAIEREKLGVLAVEAEGMDSFTGEHARLLSLLHEPFAIAMSNFLRYQEVLKLKDMLADDNRYLHSELMRISGDEIIGAEKGLKGVMEMVEQVATLDSPALLLGETGVGKEVIANAIHYASARKNGPFIKVNCGAIPDTLVDSELFGHEKGAFTGAIKQKRGRFERAHKGTIFLDEIGELPPQAQVRLLRVLQTKEIERVGGSRTVPLDIRVISATHGDLEKMVRQKTFREDLWFRLNVFPIVIPPLRQRREDIADLVNHFLEKKSKELKLRVTPRVGVGAMERLKSYHWPGNVRELENIIERALIRNRTQTESRRLSFNDFMLPPGRCDNGVESDSKGDVSAIGKIDEILTSHIQHALQLSRGKVEGPKGAAQMLGINPNTLRSKMKKLNIAYGKRSSFS